MQSFPGARVALLALAVALLPGCSSTDDPDPGPSSSQDAVRALPDPVEGRLVRILGSGNPYEAMTATVQRAAGTSVYLPRALLALDADTLQGSQFRLPTLFTLSTGGRVTPAPVLESGGANVALDLLGSEASALSAAVDGARVVEVFDDGRVQVAGREDARVTGGARVPGRPAADAASLFRVGGTLRLVYAGRWFAVGGVAQGRPTLRAARAPVPGAVVAAPYRDGLTVLTKDRVVTVDGSGRAVSSQPWRVPARQRGESVTSAIGDGSGGLLVTVTKPTDQTSQSIGGAVLRIGRDGSVATVAQGRPPDGSSSGCDDADRPADDAHLAQPVSLAKWGDRLVVADAGCGSVLQMPFPS